MVWQYKNNPLQKAEHLTTKWRYLVKFYKFTKEDITHIFCESLCSGAHVAVLTVKYYFAINRHKAASNFCYTCMQHISRHIIYQNYLKRPLASSMDA